MQESGDRVFLIRKGEITTIPSRSMSEGLFGKSLEDALQMLFEHYPEILPGNQIAAGSEDPPRFGLLRREMPVGSSWSLDHLYVDQHGVLTLVETKLTQNPESRREVIGQIVEYAANAQSSWNAAVIRQSAAEYWDRRGEALETIIQALIGADEDTEAFWELVDAELGSGNIRLIIASDSLRLEVRKMIEYLNSEMRNAQILGLELACFADQDDSVVLAPRLVGQSSQLVEQKTSGRKIVFWNEERLRRAFENLDNVLRGERLTSVLDWAVSNDVAVFSSSVNPAFGIEGKSGTRIASLYGTGHVFALFEPQKFEAAESDREQFLSRLQDASLLDSGLRLDKIKSGKTCSQTLDELDDRQFEQLMQIFMDFSAV